ncbi:MAG: CidA/LrgA family protein [Anaerolineae bacterium]|nr:CidA/LrgA family protein [Anaerolineae bacterium]
MIGGLAVLLVCQLIGELLAALLQLPIPGPVIGMILLFCGLLARDWSLRSGGSRRENRRHRDTDGNLRGPMPVPQGLESAAQGLLRYLALLFVPAGTGIIAYLALIREEWLAITIALIGSTILTLAVTGGLMQALAGGVRAPAREEGSSR